MEFKGRTVAWEDVPTEVLAREQRYWQLDPKAAWHGYRNLGQDVAMVDPTKLMLTTPRDRPRERRLPGDRDPGHDPRQLSARDHIIPEKNDLNSILFLMTPAEGEGKVAFLLAELERFKSLYEADAPLARVVPGVAARYAERYAGYSLRQLCDEMHRFYSERNVKELQRLSFRYECFPEQAMSARGGTGDGRRRGRLRADGRGPWPDRGHAGADLPARDRDRGPGERYDEKRSR